MSIQLKISTEAGKVPVAADLIQGELAMNTVDGKLYAKNSVETVFRLLTTLDRRPDVRAAGATDESVVTETGIRAAINAAVSGITGVWGISGNNIYNVNTGNVGIGTQAPVYKLQVNGSSIAGMIASQMGFNILAVANPAQLTGNLAAGGNVDTGLHGYFVTFYTQTGETNSAGPFQITTTPGFNSVVLNVPISSDPRVVGRRLYRTKAGSAYSEFLLATIPNNTATTYTDTAADSTLSGLSSVSYYRVNSTSQFITINDVRILVSDINATYLGLHAGSSVTTGGYNTFIGSQAGRYLTTGVGNTFIGQQAASLTTSGNNNIAIGVTSLYGNVTGSFNVAIGSSAGRYAGASGSTANSNPLFNTYIGVNTRSLAQNTQNEIVIGYATTGGGTNSVTIGNDSIVKTLLKGYVGIGTLNPEFRLDVNGEAIFRPGPIGFALGHDFYGGETGLYNMNHGTLIVGCDSSNDSIVMVGQNIMYLDQGTGLVGIGKSNPQTILDIYGTLTALTAKFTSVATQQATSLLGRDASGALTSNVLPLIFGAIQPHIAGAGLSGNNYTGVTSVTWAVNFAGSGTANTVSRSDHAHSLAGLSDVLIVDPSAGHILKYDTTFQKWVSAPGPGEPLWSRTDTILRPSFNFDRVEVSTSGSNIAINGNSVSGIGVYGTSNSSYGIAGMSVSGAGVYGTSSSNIGVYGLATGAAGTAGVRGVSTGGGSGVSAQSVSGHAVTGNSTSGHGGYFFSTNGSGAEVTSVNGSGLQVNCLPSDASNKWTAVVIARQTSGASAPGIGVNIDFQIEQASGIIQDQAHLSAVLTDTSTAGLTSVFDFSLRESGGILKKFARMTPSNFSFEKDRGYIIKLQSYRDYTGTPGRLKMGDEVGTLSFDAWSSATTYSGLAAGIKAVVTADHTSVSMPTALEFFITPAGAVTPANTLTLTDSGNVRANQGFATLSGVGISGTFYMLTAIGLESGTRNLIIGRASMTLSGGIVIAREDLSNITIPLP